MSRKGGSFGLVILVVVMAVVLLLVAEAWKKFGSSAVEVSDRQQAGSLRDHGQPDAGREIRSGRAPRLQQAQESADAHAGAVEEALSAIE